MNTIWYLEDDRGRRREYFEELAETEVEHFQNLFKAPAGANIAEIMSIAQAFPRFVGEEENLSLMEEVSKEELKVALQSFQKDKSPGPDGWTIEFFIDLYDVLGADLLKVVEDTRLFGRISACFNSTFIALIPKVDNPKSLHDFRPISLCNCIYKVITKVISQRLKDLLSDHISGEQFGFLKGR